MCGLYGIINSKMSSFQKDIFTVLGIANDRRGKDSCGIFIDGKVEYGIGKRALFEDFFWDSELLNNTTQCQIALGHDRKASSGGVTLEKAHPIIIKNDNGDVDFVLIHNGTIHNYEELAKKYIPNEDCKNLSDSQVLALILYHTGFDVLSEYNGGTAFVAVDYRKGEPITYLYKGASKMYAGDKTEEVERPLFLTFNEDRLIFSSIASFLCALVPDEVYEAKDNRVYKYVNGKLYLIKTIDRSKCQQYRSYYSGTWDYSKTTTNNYMQYEDATNLYRDESKKTLHGRYRVTSYGKILQPNEKVEITPFIKVFTLYFYDGIPFKDKAGYNYCKRIHRKSGLQLDAFTKKYIADIRSKSLSKVFFINNMCYYATSETSFIPFSGNLYVIGRCAYRKFSNGICQSTCYAQSMLDVIKELGICEIT